MAQELLTHESIQTDERIKWCDDNIISYLGIKPIYTINENNELIIYGNIIICNEIEELPIKINKVYGSLYLDNSIKKQPGIFRSLKNMPDVVTGCFNISMNPLITTLAGGPTIVGGSYWCTGCGLVNLEGIASEIGGALLAFSNKIEDISVLNECDIHDEICLDRNPITEDFQHNSEYQKIMTKLNAYY